MFVLGVLFFLNFFVFIKSLSNNMKVYFTLLGCCIYLVFFFYIFLKHMNKHFIFFWDKHLNRISDISLNCLTLDSNEACLGDNKI